MKKILLLLMFCMPLCAQAVTYSFGSGGFFTPNNPPPCSGGSWSRSGSVFTCTGRVVLADGDEVYVSTAAFEGLGNITVVANNGFEIINNIMGTSAKTITLQSGYGSINTSGTNTINGSVNSASGAINMSNTTVTGSITTQSVLTMNGGSVGGNITANNGVNLTQTNVTGTITSSNGSITLSGGQVNGLVRSQCCGVVTNNTDLLGGARSDSSFITITGGTLQGNFYAANNPATFSGVTLLSGAVSGASTIEFSNSSLGSPLGSVTVSSQSGAITLNDTTAYGDFTAPVWSSVIANGSSMIIGNCIPGSTPATACQTTPALTCFSDNFNRSSLGNEWISSRFSGDFTPSVMAQRLLLTQDVVSQATATTLQRWFPAQGNLVEIEFDHFAWSGDGGSGADGIALVFSDATVTPQTGSSGGSLGYAQSSDADGFAGGWVGIALDEYGNFSNPTEGRLGGPGSRAQSISVRGSGSGQNGYRYITGTATLTPAIDRRSNSAAGPGYRYRITIDARMNNAAYVSVQRRTSSGGSFSTLIAPVNVATAAGQTIIPQNLWLSLTGSTGARRNNHAIDNLQVCARTINPVGALVHHFEMEFASQGLTCSPHSVVVRACANAACSALITDTVNVTLSPSGWVGGDTKTITGGSAVFQLRNNTATSAALDVPVSMPARQAFTQNLCRRDGGALGANCTVNFSDSGFVIEVQDFIAQQGSSAALIKAVKKDDITQACVPGFSNTSKQIALWSDYVNPGAAARVASLPVQIDGVAISASSSLPTSIALNFNAAGEAPLQVNYADSGLMQLNARLLASGDDTGLVMNGSGQFSSRPAGLCVRSGGECAAADSGCPVFTAAGSEFPLQIQAVANDTDGDGDLCTGALPTPSFSISNVQLSAQVEEPAAGADGVITPATYAHQSAIGNRNTVNIRQSETGIFRFSVTPSAAYFGHVIALGISQPIGRFIPAEFSLNASHGGRLAAYCQVASPFAYSGQDIAWQVAPQLQVTALNAQGVTTQNYTFPGFMRLSPAAIHAAISGSGTDNHATGTDGQLLPVVFSAEEGSLAVQAPLSGLMNYDFSSNDLWQYSKSTNSRVAEFTPQPVIQINSFQDADGVAASPFSWSPLADFTLRYGRLRMENAYGPETQPLIMPVKSEYWNGTRFITNTDDHCWNYTAAGAALSPAGLTTVSGYDGTLIQGVAEAVNLTAPGVGNTGTVTVNYTVPVFLQDDFSGTGTLESPSGQATFGTYRGHDRIIYWREVGR